MSSSFDSGWEGKAAKVLDDLHEEGHVLSWVKKLVHGPPHSPTPTPRATSATTSPDFIVHCRLAGGLTANLLVEITGLRPRQRGQTLDSSFIADSGCQSHRCQPWVPEMDFLELDEQRAIADFRNLLLARLKELALAEPLEGVWAARRDYELENGLVEEDFELPSRATDPRPFPSLFRLNHASHPSPRYFHL